jgi:hypothetical protein
MTLNGPFVGFPVRLSWVTPRAFRIPLLGRQDTLTQQLVTKFLRKLQHLRVQPHGLRSREELVHGIAPHTMQVMLNGAEKPTP